MSPTPIPSSQVNKLVRCNRICIGCYKLTLMLQSQDMELLIKLDLPPCFVSPSCQSLQSLDYVTISVDSEQIETIILYLFMLLYFSKDQPYSSFAIIISNLQLFWLLWRLISTKRWPICTRDYMSTHSIPYRASKSRYVTHMHGMFPLLML